MAITYYDETSPEKKTDWPDTIEAAGRGLISGATLGSAPYFGAAGHWIMGEPYSQGLAEERAVYAQAQKEHPYAFGAGSLAGAMPAYVATGGEAGTVGLLSGAQSGLGASNLPGATPGSVAASTALGTVLGVGGQKVMNAIPNIPQVISNKLGQGADEAYQALSEQSRKSFKYPTTLDSQGNPQYITQAEAKQIVRSADTPAQGQINLQNEIARRQQNVASDVAQQVANPWKGAMGVVGKTGLYSGLGAVGGLGESMIFGTDPYSAMEGGAVTGAALGLGLKTGAPYLSSVGQRYAAGGVGSGAMDTVGRVAQGLGTITGAGVSQTAAQLPNSTLVLGDRLRSLSDQTNQPMQTTLTAPNAQSGSSIIWY